MPSDFDVLAETVLALAEGQGASGVRDRLIAQGHSEDESKRIIAHAVAGLREELLARNVFQSGAVRGSVSSEWKKPDVHLCSDDDCLCAGTESLVPGENGYLFVSETLVAFRRTCPTLFELDAALKAKETDGTLVLVAAGTVNPLMICGQAPIALRLDLATAAADAKMWAASGRVPLRPTPLRQQGMGTVTLAGPAPGSRLRMPLPKPVIDLEQPSPLEQLIRKAAEIPPVRSQAPQDLGAALEAPLTIERPAREKKSRPWWRFWGS